MPDRQIRQASATAPFTHGRRIPREPRMAVVGSGVAGLVLAQASGGTTARMLSEWLGQLLFWMFFIGVNRRSPRRRFLRPQGMPPRVSHQFESPPRIE